MRPVSITCSTDSELIRKLREKGYSHHYRTQVREEIGDRVRKYCANHFPGNNVRFLQ